MHSPVVDNLISQLTRLPGIGTRTAQRLAFHILRAPKDEALSLAEAIREAKERVGFCRECGNLTEDEVCSICLDARRDHSVICVIEQPADLWSLERTREYRGVYHVLGGALSPLDGVDPEDIRIEQLLRRVERNGVEEVGACHQSDDDRGSNCGVHRRAATGADTSDAPRERTSGRKRSRVRRRGHARQGAVGSPGNVTETS